uniref:uncharacterized WD repeat-containing protein C17D11.16-like n=1 Tax=Erigeron canadensis TaxID=72917 RepID=UPI001CB8BD47|nr:uncharacterized WD repeat-containing protein C17D11.16-like [Erigeron canadensis]
MEEIRPEDMEPLISWSNDNGGELLVYRPIEDTNASSSDDTNDSAGTFQVSHHIDTMTARQGDLTKCHSIDITRVRLKKTPSVEVPETAKIDPPLCMECLHFNSVNSIAFGMRNSIQIRYLRQDHGGDENDFYANEKIKKKFLFGGTRLMDGKKDGVAVCKEWTRRGSHETRVLDLSINQKRDLLASAGADKEVKIWSLETSKRLTDIKLHELKVNAVSWHHGGRCLLSGSMDRKIYMMDLREDITKVEGTKWWETNHGVKSLAWNPTVDHKFMALLDDGEVIFYDSRNFSPENSIPASENKADKISAVAYHPCKKNVFATGSSSGELKVWDQNQLSQHLSEQKVCKGKISKLTYRTNDPILAYASSSYEVGTIKDES